MRSRQRRATRQLRRSCRRRSKHSAVCVSIITTGCATARTRESSLISTRRMPMPTRLEPIRPLVDELAAELKAREAQEDSTVPTAYNGYIYERRFSQGAQYP